MFVYTYIYIKNIRLCAADIRSKSHIFLGINTLSLSCSDKLIQRILHTQIMSLYLKLMTTAKLQGMNLYNIKNISALINFIFAYEKRFCTLIFNKLFIQFKK